MLRWSWARRLGADVPDGEGAEAGGDAVDGFGLGGQLVHDHAGRGQGGQRLAGQLDPGAVRGPRR